LKRTRGAFSQKIQFLRNHEKWKRKLKKAEIFRANQNGNKIPTAYKRKKTQKLKCKKNVKKNVESESAVIEVISTDESDKETIQITKKTKERVRKREDKNETYQFNKNIKTAKYFAKPILPIIPTRDVIETNEVEEEKQFQFDTIIDKNTEVEKAIIETPELTPEPDEIPTFVVEEILDDRIENEQKKSMGQMGRLRNGRKYVGTY
jgi:hypothetical protein